ncbi:MAG: trypsin-like peptidase domain-containing protein [Bacteroidales bacterium]|nr:trypsin-like peptidase domain-containing protein [Bacteroidales bacterium]
MSYDSEQLRYDSGHFPQARRGHPSRALPTLLALLVGLLAGGLILRYLVPAPGAVPQGPLHDPTAVEREVVPSSAPDSDEVEAIELFRKVKPSVVNVDTIALVRRLDMRVQEQQAGTGSGFVWDDQGRIVTNFHVIQSALQNNLTVRVVLADRTVWDARIIGVAPNYDLAVIQIAAPKEKLKPITVGTSKDLEVGRKVFAIGNPYALSLTMTTGIVSALDREIESPGDRPIAGVIQTDAAINPGNSGGPLLDKNGRLVGVNTAIASPSGGNVGIGFAIPVDTVNPVVTELIQRGRILQPDLGIRLVDLRRLRRAGFPRGVMIDFVDPKGSAAQAGLRGLRTDPQTGDLLPGDLILKVDGQSVNSNPEFANALAARKVGDTLKLIIERDEVQSEIPVTVGGV